ncbi:MAG: galactokinase [Actinomycetota bacterium]
MTIGIPRRQALAEALRSAGGDPARARVFRAPGRINLLGEHTDYNHGFVLPAAIDLDVAIAAVAESGVFLAVSAQMEGQAVFDPESPRLSGDSWGSYLQGVAWSLSQYTGRVGGIRAGVHSTVPVGSGLSSSAALEVATGLALSLLAGHAVAKEALAAACLRAERQWVGVNCGPMDQWASVFGQRDSVILLDCRTMDIETVHLPEGLCLAVVDSGTPRTLAEGGYNRRRSECEQAARLLGVPALRDVGEADIGELPEPLLRRARHVVRENARVMEGVNALRAGDTGLLGELIDASHESLRADFEVSTPELDAAAAACRTCPGVLGARMVGGGFGGSVMAVAWADAVDALPERMERLGFSGLRVVRASEGAGEVVGGLEGLEGGDPPLGCR